MKNQIFYFLLIIITISCKGQNNEILKINSAKVSEIKIKNKLSYSRHELNNGKVIITSKSKIDDILNSLSSSKKLTESANLGANYGYFDIEIIEGEKSHLYGIVYTVYDGVIIRNYNGNANSYKNDELERMVYGLFVK